jgi:hypothetical protein
MRYQSPHHNMLGFDHAHTTPCCGFCLGLVLVQAPDAYPNPCGLAIVLRMRETLVRTK